jgi:hypothetical protein
MFRNVPRRRILLVVVIAMVGLNLAPIDECDDYAFLYPGAASARAEVPGDDPCGFEHQHLCSCVVCELTTNDTFVPRLAAPQRGEAVADVPAVPCSSPYLPGIYRPPIA